MNKLKFALIGCGRIGQRHAEHIIDESILVAVCDNDKIKAERFGANFKSRHYTAIEDLLKQENDLDVVSICTPNGLHAEHTILSLRARSHVLCEKPMAINVHDCGRMIQEAESHEDKNEKIIQFLEQNKIIKK